MLCAHRDRMMRSPEANPSVQPEPDSIKRINGEACSQCSAPCRPGFMALILTAAVHRSVFCSTCKERLGSWYPTSRKKRARCGAPMAPR